MEGEYVPSCVNGHSIKVKEKEGKGRGQRVERMIQARICHRLTCAGNIPRSFCPKHFCAKLIRSSIASAALSCNLRYTARPDYMDIQGPKLFDFILLIITTKDRLENGITRSLGLEGFVALGLYNGRRLGLSRSRSWFYEMFTTRLL